MEMTIQAHLPLQLEIYKSFAHYNLVQNLDENNPKNTINTTLDMINNGILSPEQATQVTLYQANNNPKSINENPLGNQGLAYELNNEYRNANTINATNGSVKLEYPSNDSIYKDLYIKDTSGTSYILNKSKYEELKKDSILFNLSFTMNEEKKIQIPKELKGKILYAKIKYSEGSVNGEL